MSPRLPYDEIPDISSVYSSGEEIEEMPLEGFRVVENPESDFVQDHVSGSTVRMLVYLGEDNQRLFTIDFASTNTVQDLINELPLDIDLSQEFTIHQIWDPTYEMHYLVTLKDSDSEDDDSPQSPDDPHNVDEQDSSSASENGLMCVDQEKDSPDSPTSSPFYSTQERDSPLSPENILDRQPAPIKYIERDSPLSPENNSDRQPILKQYIERDSPLSPENIFDRQPLSKEYIERDSPLSPDNSYDTKRAEVSCHYVETDSPASPTNPYDRGIM